MIPGTTVRPRRSITRMPAAARGAAPPTAANRPFLIVTVVAIVLLPSIVWIRPLTNASCWSGAAAAAPRFYGLLTQQMPGLGNLATHRLEGLTAQMIRGFDVGRKQLRSGPTQLTGSHDTDRMAALESSQRRRVTVRPTNSRIRSRSP